MSELDPSEITTAYVRILTSGRFNPFPDANPDFATWTTPSPALAIVHLLLYATFVTSNFTAFLVMLRK